MSLSELEGWSQRLKSLARAALDQTPLVANAPEPPECDAFIRTFSDELGHKRVVDRAVLSRLLGIDPGPALSGSPDVAWWWSLSGWADRPTPAPSGAITPVRSDQGIELWSEIELGSLHAAWNAALDEQDSALHARCLEATAWHVRELHPDNATAHAWALHGFVLCAHETGLTEAWVHAEMLLHACMVGMGRPDRFSACLMLDAGRALERVLRR